VSSRKEQKEALRRERLAREEAARAAQRRRQLMGYGVGGALVLAAVVVVAVILLAGGGSGSGEKGEDLYPDASISNPGPLSEDVEAAAEAADCVQESKRAKSRDHLQDPNASERYEQNPPTSGRHYFDPAPDGIYDEAPRKEQLVHTLEHGRVILWFKPDAPGEVRGKLKALFEDEGESQLVLTPNDTGMPYLVAASAWSIDPRPVGTGRLLGCRRFEGDKTIDALRAFIAEHRGNGPEPVP
jgi:hypothetical protein